MLVYILTIFLLVVLIIKKEKEDLKKLFYIILLLFSFYFLILPIINSNAKRLTYFLMLSVDIAFILNLYGKIEKMFKKLILLLKIKSLTKIFLLSIITIGTIEGIVFILSEFNLIKLYSPLIIMGRGKSEDWREAHITGEKSKVYDPLLFWKPSNKYPYNSYGFKGKIFDKTKTGKKRIFFYGDSNTDGQDEIYYPKFVQDLLGDSFEIFNAGVAGWTSYQGLKRLKFECDEWHPDIVFFSFGWNDCANAIGKEDKEYSPPPKIIVSIQRFLLQYKTTLLFLNFLKKDRTKNIKYLPRVNKVDYVENIKAAYNICIKRGIQFVVLTRPYVYDSTFFKTDSTFRRFVPLYNETLRIFANENNIPIIDVEREFYKKDSFFLDESHFNTQGYKHLAEIIKEYIEKIEK